MVIPHNLLDTDEEEAWCSRLDLPLHPLQLLVTTQLLALDL